MTGALAGLVAGVTIDCYLLTMLLVFEHGSVAGFYQFVASGLVGKAAAANPGTVPLGVAAHFAVSACWGIGYAYVAATTPQLNARPFLSGAVYGVVVLFAMLLIEVGANIFTLPRGNYDLLNLIVSHTVFFGIPVAYIVASRMKRPAAT